MARIPAAERRSDLVAAAVRMIATRGVEGATTRRIAQEANAPLATLHYCFATKELLFGAVFEHIAAQYREVLTCNDVHSDLQTTARELLRGMLQWYLANPNFGAAIIELISWARRQEGQQAEMVYDEAFATLRGILATAASTEGEPEDPDTIDALAYIMSVLSDGFAMNWLAVTDDDAGASQIELTLAVLDAWMDSRLGNLARPPAPASKTSSEVSLRSLVSWVNVQ